MSYNIKTNNSTKLLKQAIIAFKSLKYLFESYNKLIEVFFILVTLNISYELLSVFIYHRCPLTT